ncbi:hypothetical protein P355_0653 [Burkholderia cenocepacia KC-01]|nr:hypothetical protein P355_0653 [Burkholderia cenocepacia KC-01]
MYSMHSQCAPRWCITLNATDTMQFMRDMPRDTHPAPALACRPIH